jgi:hypothetical protein
MTHSEFSHILASIPALSPDQMRQLARELKSRMTATAKRAKPARPKKQPRTEEEVLRQMLADGLITRLPVRDADVDDEDDEPVVIEGEPLSETVIRERR